MAMRAATTSSFATPISCQLTGNRRSRHTEIMVQFPREHSSKWRSWGQSCSCLLTSFRRMYFLPTSHLSPHAGVADVTQIRENIKTFPATLKKALDAVIALSSKPCPVCERQGTFHVLLATRMILRSICRHSSSAFVCPYADPRQKAVSATPGSAQPS